MRNSPKLSLIMTDGSTVEFEYGNQPYLEEDCEIGGIRLAYAHNIMQDVGIFPLQSAFLVRGGVINRVPLLYKGEADDGVKAIGYKAKLDDEIIQQVEEEGMVAYWNNESFLICASLEYDFLIDKIRKLFIPNHLSIFLEDGEYGKDLLILAM